MSINATTLSLGSLAAPAHRPPLKTPGQATEWKDFAATTANTAATNMANTASTVATNAATAANTAVTETAQSLRASLSALLLQAQEARGR